MCIRNSIKTSQGGNSVLVDSDGAVYNVFHTRFVRTTGNLEEHQVRVQQMVASPDGWLVSLPFEKSGSADLATQHSRQSLVGAYNVVVHDPTQHYSGGGDSDAGVVQSQRLTLNADGTLAGSVTGTWALSGSALTLTVASSTGGKLRGVYRVTVAEQTDELGSPELVFSGDGGNVFTNSGADVAASAGRVAIWGSRVVSTNTAVAACAGSSEVAQTGTSGGVANPTAKSTSNAKPTQTERTVMLARTGTAVTWVNLAMVATGGVGASLSLLRRFRAV